MAACRHLATAARVKYPAARSGVFDCGSARKVPARKQSESRQEREGFMITSTANQKIKRIVQLNKKAGERKKEDVFVVEGLKMFLEVPEERLCEVYLSESFLPILEGLGEKGKKARQKLEVCGYEMVSDEVFRKISDTQAPQGILCIVRQCHYSLEEVLREKECPLLLVLENLQDPGNLGTILRAGEGAGVCGVVMSRDTADIYNPKVIRATMGSIYRMPFFYTENLEEAIIRIKEAGVTVFAAHLKGEGNYDKCDYCRPSAFLIGNEGKGLTERTADLADSYVKIPMEGKVESLNAAVAAALLVYEAARQRRERD